MSAQPYRKKPVVVEAIQFDGSEDSQREIVNWTMGKAEGWVDHEYHLVIRTLEGDHRASPGDWIIRGVQGEFYPCKPDIFEQTYEAVPTPDAADPRFPNHIPGCICPRFTDIAPSLLADLCCPIHGVGGTQPGDVIVQQSESKS
jgi:hypothetical protein